MIGRAASPRPELLPPPVLTGRIAPALASQRVHSEPLVVGARARMYWAIVLVWAAANLSFWPWWLRSANVDAPWFYALFTVCFAYQVTFLPSVYLFFVGRMRKPDFMAAEPGRGVALITLCVPSSESIDVIRREMQALVAVTYLHDSWILDEGGEPAIRAEADRLGVRYFTRKGIDRYNQPGAPFKAKTKAGNVNAWIDAHGAGYEFFVQLDIDHVPHPDYLDRVLGYFRDPAVAWVQGPSLYGNLESWIARGAAEQELVLQGPLQQGFFGASETPFIIGSHCTYRTAAVREIGGFQPTRAEDHLDTLVLSAHGYRGVFVPEVLAVGDGPESFETYLRQQFAWASSLMEVLFFYTPRLIWQCRSMPAFQFLFAQTWYLLWSATMLVLFALPLIALITHQRPSGVPLPVFLLACAPIDIAGVAVWWWTRRWQMPAGLHLSWRGVVLHVARWPIVFWAFVNVVLRVKHPYMITPKGRAGLPYFGLRTQAIYLVAVWVTMAVVWAYLLSDGWDGAPRVEPNVLGFTLLGLWGSFFMLLVVFTNLGSYLRDLHRRGLPALRAVRLAGMPLVVVALTTACYVATIAASGGRAVSSSEWLGEPAMATQRDLTGTLPALKLLRQPASAAPGATHAPEPTHAAPLAAPAPSVQATTLPAATPEPPLPEPTATVLPMDLPRTGVSLGAYDPWQQLTSLPLTLEHWYVRQDDPTTFLGALNHARNRRIVLITVEPFSPDAADRTLEDIAAGGRDAELRQLADIARNAAPQVVLLRWGHEMELANLYPWSGRDPAAYRSAYRRVVGIFEAERATNVRWIWSPAGNPEASRYYPGDDVVDYVGMTILGDEQWDRTFGLPPQSFAELVRPKYRVLAAFGKPMILAEVGVSGSEDRKQQWLRDASASLGEFPGIRALSYYDDVNAPTNRLAKQPDWRVPPGSLGDFVAGQPTGT